MANKKIQATAQLFLNTKEAQKDAQKFVEDLKQRLSDIESAADKMTVFKDMVDYIAQIDRAMANLKKHNKDVFGHMFDGIDTNLRVQLESLFGVSGEQLGQIDVLREKLKTLTPKSSIKELRGFAEEINKIFTSLGVSTPFNNIAEQFSGRASAEHIELLTNALANLATVWQDVNLKIANGFGLGGSGGSLISPKIQGEIDDLEQKIKHYESVMNKFNSVAAMKKKADDYEPIDLDFDVSGKAVDGLINRYNELQDILNAVSQDSIEYADALAERAKVAMQLIELDNQLVKEGPEKKRLQQFIWDEGVEEYPLEDFAYEFEDQMKNINKLISDTRNEISLLKQSAVMDKTGSDFGFSEQLNSIDDAAGQAGEKVDMLGKKLVNVSEYVSALSGQLKEMFATAGRSANFEYHIAIDGLDIKARHGSEKSVDLATQTETYLDTLFSDSVLYGHSHRGGTAATNIYDIETVLGSYRDGVSIPVHFVVGKDAVTTIDFTGLSQDVADQLMQEIAATNSNKNAPVRNEVINKIAERFTGKSEALKTWNVDQFDDLARYIYDISSAASSALTPVEKFQAVLDNMFGKGKVDASRYESLLSGLNQDNVKNIFNQIASIEKLQPIKTTDMLTMGQVNAEIDESIAKYKTLREEANLSYSDIRNEVDKVIEHYHSGGSATSGLDFFKQYFPEGEWQKVRDLLTDAYDNMISLEEVTNRIASEFGVDPDTFAQIPNAYQDSQIDQAKAKVQEFMDLYDEIMKLDSNYNVDDVGIGQYTERLEVAKRELDELGAQGLITADELKEVEKAFDSSKIHLDLETMRYTGHGNNWGDASSYDLRAAEEAAEAAQKRAEEAEYEALSYQRSASSLAEDNVELHLENDRLREQLAQKEASDDELEVLRQENGALEEKLELLQDIAEQYANTVTPKNREKYEELNQKDMDSGLTAKQEERFWELGEAIDLADQQLEEFGETYDKIILKLSNGKKIEILPDDAGLRKFDKIANEYYGGEYNGHEIEDVIFVRKQERTVIEENNQELREQLDLQKQIKHEQQDVSQTNPLITQYEQAPAHVKELINQMAVAEDRMQQMTSNIEVVESRSWQPFELTDSQKNKVLQWANQYKSIIQEISQIQIVQTDDDIQRLVNLVSEARKLGAHLHYARLADSNTADYAREYGLPFEMAEELRGIIEGGLNFGKETYRPLLERLRSEFNAAFTELKSQAPDFYNAILSSAFGMPKELYAFARQHGGEVAIFDDVIEGAAKAEFAVEGLNDEIKETRDTGVKAGVNTNEATNGTPVVDTSAELAQLEILQSKLLDVKTAIDAKTQAFEDERVAVDGVVDAEIASLQSLINQLQEVIAQVNLVGEAFNNINADVPKIEISGKLTEQNSSSTENTHYVTDPQGRPVTMYRGIRNSYSGLVSNRYHGGTFSTDNLELAKEYAGELGKVEKVLLSMKNPLEIDGHGAFWNKIEYIGDNSDEASQKLYELNASIRATEKLLRDAEKIPVSEQELKNISRGLISEDDTKRAREISYWAKELKQYKSEKAAILADTSNPYGRKNTNELVEIAKAKGYDGVIFKDIIDSATGDVKDLSTVMVTFEQDQIHYLETISSTFEISVAALKNHFGDLTKHISASSEEVESSIRKMVELRGKVNAGEISEDEYRAFISENAIARDYEKLAKKSMAVPDFITGALDGEEFELKHVIQMINDMLDNMRHRAQKIAKTFGKEGVPFGELLRTNAIEDTAAVVTTTDTVDDADNVSHEITQLERLQVVLVEVKNAVLAKTKAFYDEGNVVGQVVGKEISALNKLLETINEIVQKVDALSTKMAGIRPIDFVAQNDGGSASVTKSSAKTEDKFQTRVSAKKGAMTKYIDELSGVQYVTDDTREKLVGLRDALDTVKTPKDLNDIITKFEDLQTIIGILKATFEDVGLAPIRGAKNGLLSSFKALNEGQQLDVEKDLGKVILQLNTYENMVLNGQKVELRAINDTVSALRRQIETYKEDNKEAKKAGASTGGNASFGSTASINATAKYNSLSRVATSDQFVNSSEVANALATYEKSYQHMMETRDRIRNINGSIPLVDEAAFKEARDECNKYAKDLEKIINSSLKLKAEKINPNDYMLGSDFNYLDPDSRKAELANFAKQMYDVDLGTENFKKSFSKAVFDVANDDGTITKITATFTAARNEIVAMAGDTEKSVGLMSQLWNQYKGKVKSIFAYFMATISVYDVWRVIKQGVQYVREIDSALTELKKVTDATDASYAKFLQDMSSTGSVIGATVKDLTTMAAEWARLGYSMEEAGTLAKSTAILLNVSEFGDATAASEALISTMQAFGYAADESMHVVDILNEVKFTCLLMQ